MYLKSEARSMKSEVRNKASNILYNTQLNGEASDFRPQTSDLEIFLPYTVTCPRHMSSYHQQ